MGLTMFKSVALFIACFVVSYAENSQKNGRIAPWIDVARTRFHGASNPAEPVIALILPIAAGVGVADENGSDMLGVFKPQLGGHP